MIYNVDKKYLEWLIKNPGINPTKQLVMADLKISDKEWRGITKFNRWLEEEFETFYLWMERQGKFKQMDYAKAWSYAMDMFGEERGVAPRWYNRGVKAWVKATFREHENLNDKNIMQNLYSANFFMNKMNLFHEKPSFAAKMMMHSTLSLIRQFGVGIGKLMNGNVSDNYSGDKLAKDNINKLTDGSVKSVIDEHDSYKLNNDDIFQKTKGDFEGLYKNTVDMINKSKKGITAAHIDDIIAEADKSGYEREEYTEALIIFFAARGVKAELMNENIIFSRQDSMFI